MPAALHVDLEIERAKRFYQGVFGWQTSKMLGADATVFGVGSAPDQAVADVQKANGMPPAWLTYVVVEAIEPARAKAEKLGAKVMVPLVEIPTVGRISFIVDPTGGHIGLFQPQMPGG